MFPDAPLPAFREEEPGRSHQGTAAGRHPAEPGIRSGDALWRAQVFRFAGIPAKKLYSGIGKN